MKKINLLLIGAQKSGTTTLHKCMSKHTQICMSEPLKEPIFFFPIEEVKRYFAQRGIKVESKQDLLKRLMMREFRNQLYFGESSTTYTVGETSYKYELPKTVFEYNPSMKIMYIIRNPLSRIISNYRHLAQKGLVSDWESYLDSERLWNNGIYTSMYFYNLNQWNKYFDLASIHVIFFEDFIKYSEQCLEDIWRFLEINNEKIDFQSQNVSLNRSNLHFSEKHYDKIFSSIYDDCSKLSDLIGIDIFEKWNFDKDLWVNRK